jgi:hypothetical protein
MDWEIEGDFEPAYGRDGIIFTHDTVMGIATAASSLTARLRAQVTGPRRAASAASDWLRPKSGV